MYEKPMMFILYNQRLGRKLTHPVHGLWVFPTLEAAKGVQAACREMIGSMGMEPEDIVVLPFTGSEDELCQSLTPETD